MSLEAVSLVKNYGKRVVVSDVSVKINRGECVGLLGPNGAGKTTSFYMIAGLVKPDSGSVKLFDEDITKNPIYKRSKKGLSYLPQETSSFRKMSTRDNILTALELHNVPKQERLQRVDELINLFKLNKVEHSLSISLSGGERRRVEVARCLATNPKFILLDEPFAGIDPISVLDIQEMIMKLKELSIGILITDHNVRETLSITDRSYVLVDGEIIVSGDKNAILSNKAVQEKYLGEGFSI